MRKPKLLIGTAILAFLVSASVAVAAPTSVFEPTVLPQMTDTFDLGSLAKEWNTLYSKTICLSGDCKTAWPSGGGGSGTVTSVAATVPTGLSISGSPITTAGTLA